MKKTIVHKLMITLLICPLLSGCLVLAGKQETGYYGAKKHTARLTAASFQDEISELEKRTGDKTNLAVHSKSYLQLALLQLDHKNPSRNYSKALEALVKYVEAEPRAADLDEVQNWITVLKEMKKLHDEISSLKATVEKLKGDIEKLNALDLELEKKRRINR